MSKRFTIAFENNNADTDSKEAIDHIDTTLAQEAAIAVEQAIIEALDTSDRIDGLVELGSVISKIETPTETERQLIAIADSLTAGPGEVQTLANEDFVDMVSSITDKIKDAFKSIGDSVNNIYTAFKTGLKRLLFVMQTYEGQLAKLRTMLVKLRSSATRTVATINAKQQPVLFAPVGHDDFKTSSQLDQVKDSGHMKQELTSLVGNFDMFSMALAESIVVQKKRYIEAFTALFTKGASEELFFKELKDFDTNFIQKIKEKAQLNNELAHGLMNVNTSDVGIAGIYLVVTTPSTAIYNQTDKSSVLKTFDSFRFGAEAIEFDHKTFGKYRDIDVNLDDVVDMIDSLMKSLSAYDALTSKYVMGAIEDLSEFINPTAPAPVTDENGEQTTMSKAEQTVYLAKQAFKATNAVSRLQVLEARAIVDGYFSTFNNLSNLIGGVSKFIYDVLGSKEWYKQDIASI